MSDRTDMVDPEIQLLRKNPRWESLLRAYANAVIAEKQKSAGGPIWVSRILSLDEIESGELSAIHGKLIAYGFLQVDLAPQGDGMVYQLTHLGRRAANAEAELDTAEDDSAAA